MTWGRQRPASLAGLRGEVGELRAQFAEHVLEHQQAAIELKRAAKDRARIRKQTRRYWITTIATVVGSNVATILIVTVGHGHP